MGFILLARLLDLLLFLFLFLRKYVYFFLPFSEIRRRSVVHVIDYSGVRHALHIHVILTLFGAANFAFEEQSPQNKPSFYQKRSIVL